MRNQPMTRTIAFTGALLLLTGALPIAAGAYERCPEEASKCVEMMAKNLSQRGWIGINYEPTEEGEIVLTAIVPESPAEAAGLRAGDILVSLDGVAYNDDANKDKIKKIYMGFKPGDETTLVVSRNGAESAHVVTLGKLPQHMMAQWIGYHMLEGHGPAEAADDGTAEPTD